MPKSRRRNPKSSGRSHGFAGPRISAQNVLEGALARRDAILEEVHREAVNQLPIKGRKLGVSEPIEAQELLHTVRLNLEKLGASYADAMGSYSWLFYLRRIPHDLMVGRLGTSAPYRMQIAEVLSTMTSETEQFPERNGRPIVPALSGAAADKIIRLCGVTGALEQIHSVLRRAGKGQSVRWYADKLPWVVPNTELDKAIELYDKRVDADCGLGAGTQPSTFYPFFSTFSDPRLVDDFLLSAWRLDSVDDVPSWDGPARKVRKGSLLPGRYIVGGETLDETSRIFERANLNTQWVPRGLSGLVLLLRTLFRTVFNGDLNFGRSIPSVGYIVLPTRSIRYLLEAELKRIIERDLDPGPVGLPSSAGAALAELSTIKPSLWPLESGPIFRMAGDQTAIDIYSASLRLQRLLTVDNTAPSELVNARGGHFEDVVQSAIDASPWRPPEKFRQLQGRTLKIDKRSVTDVDAIAINGRIILLISCKSIPHTPELDAGIYSRVRNVRTHLEESDKEWLKCLEKLRISPKGDNFDFSGSEIVGVTCIPHVEFTLVNQTRIVLGDETGHHIRAVASLGEISTYINANFKSPFLSIS